MRINSNCEGMRRRDCLRLGLGGLIAGGLSGALRARASENPALVTCQADACILIWMDGGPSHYETFDPKPDARDRDSRPVRSDRNSNARHPVFAAHEAARQYFESTRHRPLHSSRSRQSRRRQSLHDDRAPHHAFPSAAVRSFSFHPSLGSVVAQQIGAPNGIRRTSRCPRCRVQAGQTSSARSTLRSLSPIAQLAAASECATSRCQTV